MSNQSRKKMQLNKGDTLKCGDIKELHRYVNEFAVERYDVTVDEGALLITVNGKYGPDGAKETADGGDQDQESETE